MKTLPRSKCGLCRVILTSSRGRAWNAIGHLASAKLAYDELDDGQRTELSRCFGSIRTSSSTSPPPAAEVSEMDAAILHAAVWPDWVRPRHNGSGGPDPAGRASRNTAAAKSITLMCR